MKAKLRKSQKVFAPIPDFFKQVIVSYAISLYNFYVYEKDNLSKTKYSFKMNFKNVA